MKQVYTVDIIDELAKGAERRLKRLGYGNVGVRTANGYYGWSEHGPYDKIVVTAACDLVPPPLLAQLKPGGRMIIPTGIVEQQSLTLVEKGPSGKVSTRDILAVLSRVKGPLIGADIVEYNPSRDVNGVTAVVAAKFVKEIAALAARGNE